jgi:hypothetical protein
MNNKKNFLKELRISIEICEPETLPLTRRMSALSMAKL